MAQFGSKKVPTPNIKKIHYILSQKLCKTIFMSVNVT